MKKPKMLVDPIFNVRILFFWDCAHTVVNEHLSQVYGLPEMEISHAGGLARGINHEKDGITSRFYVLWLRDPKEMFVLSHEVKHLVGEALVDRGIPYTKENDEVYAYVETYWCKRLWKLMHHSIGKGEV